MCSVVDTAYDRALLEVGEDGWFQKKFDVVYNMVLAALWCMTYMNIFLALVIPPHTCEVPDNNVNMTDREWKSKYIPRLSNITDDGKLSSCLIYIDPNRSNATKECDSYVYDKTWFASTVPSSNNWVCDREVYVANVYAYCGVAEVVGSVLFGWMGDVYGRRPTYIISLSLIVLGRLISAFGGHSYIIFIAGCFLASIPSWSVVQSCTVISMEISSARRRSRTATYRYTSLSIGVCLMALLYWWIKEWKVFFLLSTMPLLPYLLLSWTIIESPRWLWLKGNPKESIRILKLIAKANKTTLEPNTESELLTTSSVHTPILGPLALFSSWTLTVNTILQLLIWITVTISYRMLLIISGEKTDGNPFLEFGWQALIEVPGNFVGQWLADHLGRRYAGVTASGVTALMWTLIAFRESHTSWLAAWWVGVALRTICRVSNTTVYYTINLFNMELYPTCLRQSGMSLGNVFSAGASAVAPYIVIFGRQYSPSFPGAMATTICLFGLLSSFLLPETLHAKLPETLEDAQEFGRRRDRKYSSLLAFRRPVEPTDKDTELCTL